jgi:hypothetical protein
MARFDNLGKAIGIAVSKDEKGIKSLLRRNGVSTANITSKLQLSDVFVESLVASKGLGNDFANYIKSKDNANASGFYNMDAFANIHGNMDTFANVVGDGVPDAYNMSGGDNSNTNQWSPSGSSMSVNADGENEEEKEKGGFWEGLNLADLLNTGKELYLAKLKGDTVSDETEQIKIASETQLNNDLSPNIPLVSQESNTGLYIGLGVLGLAVVVGAIYVFTKKK